MGCFLWCIALLCPMDRAFLARCLIASAGFLIVSVDSLIVSSGGIRGRWREGSLSRKRIVFLLFRGNLYLCSRECLEFSDWSGAFLVVSDWSDWSDGSEVLWGFLGSRTGRTGRRSS